MGKMIKEAILKDFGETIDYILSVSEHDKTDTQMREKVALSLARAVRQSQMRGGNISPRESNLHKLAVLMHDNSIGSVNEFLQRAKKAMKKYGTISAISGVINRSGVEFKPVNPTFRGEWKTWLTPTRAETKLKEPKVLSPLPELPTYATKALPKVELLG